MPFDVMRTVGQSNTEPSLSVSHWNMVTADKKNFLSPWHDVTIQPSLVEHESTSSSTLTMKDDAAQTLSSPRESIEVTNKVSGVIEVTRNTQNDMSLSKDLPHNPIVQKVEIDNATGMPRISQFYNAPKFNIGFVPRTYNSHFDKDIEDQTTFALPLIDLSQRLK